MNGTTEAFFCGKNLLKCCDMGGHPLFAQGLPFSVVRQMSVVYFKEQAIESSVSRPSRALWNPPGPSNFYGAL